MVNSIYVHIPYCIQRCHYCDFTTFEQNSILPPSDYTELVRKEIRQRSSFFNLEQVKTIYFGGGTPSLIPAKHIVSILNELANCGMKKDRIEEVTIEINPATLNPEKIKLYQEHGVNRFSVGAQSFNDDLLKRCGREHSTQETLDTLNLLKDYSLNYSLDLLFALPKQSLEDLANDLSVISKLNPQHVSAYCLTLPTAHPMQKGRPIEGVQIEMFQMIKDSLLTKGLQKYEISNFSRPGMESQHNMAYWTNKSYWGIGLSSHSYLCGQGAFGTRFWNPKSFKEYTQQLNSSWDAIVSLGTNQFEVLKKHEAVTDICHVALRIREGLTLDAVRFLTTDQFAQVLFPRLESLSNQGLLTHSGGSWTLSDCGDLLSNEVFRQLTFGAEDFLD